jgi:hypothetical protein
MARFLMADQSDLAIFKLPMKSADGTKTGEVEVSVQIQGDFVQLYVDGYGECDGDAGGGSPIVLEHWDGRLRLIAYPHINEADPIIIDMEDARESARLPEA